jgi:carboxymethylenebutenolidase
MPAFVATPASGSGPGILLLHEIFGVTEYIRRRARDLAALGYVVLVPHLYWRLAPSLEVAEDTQEGLQEAFGFMQRLDEPQAVEDAADALAYLRSMPSTGGRAGVLGFCLGGRLAYKVAAAAAPDVAVSYYGSGIGQLLDQAGQIGMPILFHFGSSDQFLPVAEAEQITAAFSSHTDAEVRMHDGGGHAFDNPSPMWHHAGSSAEAWPQTSTFLEHHLPAH